MYRVNFSSVNSGVNAGYILLPHIKAKIGHLLLVLVFISLASLFKVTRWLLTSEHHILTTLSR